MRLHSWEGAHQLWPVVLFSVLLSYTTAQQHTERKRYYYIAAVNIDWDYTSNGPHRSAPTYKKVVYREYDEGFKQAKIHPSWLGLLGPTIRGQEGETIVVTFRNMADQHLSLHAHGINYGKQSEGSLYFDNTSQFEKEDDAVPPGGEHTYYWEVTSDVAPRSTDPSCLTYTYLSHYDFVKDYNSGLIGTILICKAGSLDESGGQMFFQQEYVFLMGVFDEDKSCYKPKVDMTDATRRHIKYTINGYTNGSIPGLSVCAHTFVSLHLVGMSSEPELFSVHINGQVLQHNGHRVSSVGLITGTAASANMTAVHTGRWLLSSHTSKHLDAGMHGFVEVRTCQGFDPPKRRLTIKEKRESQEWTYYIAAEEVIWDYAPNMPELIDGDYKLEYLKQGPERIGKKYKKAVYTQYTNAAFTERAENKPRKKELGIIGPVIRAQIRDVIKVVFKNMATRPYSIYPHGLTIDKAAEGVNYPAGGNQSHGVEPGETHTYVWHVIEEDEPLAGDSQCVTRMYHSAVNTPRDIASGLIGPLLICKSQSLSKRNVQLKSDKEQHAMFAVFDENKSWYLGDNIATYSEQAKVNKDDPDFYKSNVMHTINGYVYESGQSLGFCNGEIVTWHVSSIGAQDYIQTATFYGHPFNLNDRTEDILTLFPVTGETITMNMDNVGVWLLVSLSSHETTKGMRVKFRDVECYRDVVYQYEEVSPDANLLESKDDFSIWMPEDIETIKEEKKVEKEEIKEDEALEFDDYTEKFAQLLNLRSIKNSTNETDAEVLDLRMLLNYDNVGGSDLAEDANKKYASFSSTIAPTHTSLAKEETINMSLAKNEMKNTSLAGRERANTSLAAEDTTKTLDERETTNTAWSEREAMDQRDFTTKTTLNNSVTENAMEELNFNISLLESSINNSLKSAKTTENQTVLDISSSPTDSNITSKLNNLTGVSATETTPGQIKLKSDAEGQRFIQIRDEWTNVNNTSEAEVLVEKLEDIITRGDVFAYSETLHYTSNNSEVERATDSNDVVLLGSESATSLPSGHANISVNIPFGNNTTVEQGKGMYGPEAINTPPNSSKGVSQNGTLPLDTRIVSEIMESQNGMFLLDTGIISIIESQNATLTLDTGIVSDVVESENGTHSLDTGKASDIGKSQNSTLPLDTGIVSDIVESHNGTHSLNSGIVSGIMKSQNATLPLDTGIVSGIMKSQNATLPLDTGIVSGIMKSQNATLPLDTGIVSGIMKSQNATLPLDTGIVSGIMKSQNATLPLDTGIVSGIMKSQNATLPLDTGMVSEITISRNGTHPLDSGIVSGIMKSQNATLPLDTGIVSGIMKSQNATLPLDTGIISGIIKSQNATLPLDTGIISEIVESQNATLPLDSGIVSGSVKSQNSTLPLDTGIVSDIVESQNATLSLDNLNVSGILVSQNDTLPLDTGIIFGKMKSQNGTLPLESGIVSGIVETQNGTTNTSGLKQWHSSEENKSEHKDNVIVLDALVDSSSESFSNKTSIAKPGANNLPLSTTEQPDNSSESISQSSVEEVIIYLRNNNSQVIRTTSIDLQEGYWGYEGTHEMVPMEMPDHMTKYIANRTPEPITTPETKKNNIKTVHRRQKPRKGHAMKTKKKKVYKPQPPTGHSFSPRGVKPLLNSELTPRGVKPITVEEDFSNKAIVIGVPRSDFSDYELYTSNDGHDGITLKNAGDSDGEEYEWVDYIDPYKEKGDFKDLTLDENARYFLKTAGDNVRVYFITAEEVTWDYGGYGQKRQDKSAEIERPTKFTKVVFRGYLDSTFSTPQIRGEMDEHLGILGPLIKAEVGQTIMIFFRNLASRPYSLHANGVHYNKQAEGLSYEDESNNWYKYDNEVQPNTSYTYIWKVSADAGPTKDESDCRTWAYYSGVNPEKDINSGLVGPLLVCRKGTLSQEGVNIREFMLLFMTFDESQSWYYKKNREALEGNKRRARVMVPQSRDKLKFHAINGIIFSLKGLRMYSNQMVRWHLFNLGPPSDLHSVHFHGQTFINKQSRDHTEAVYPLLPGGFATLEMLPSRPGLWQLESEVGLYQQRGMQTLFLVIDNDCASPLGLMSGSVKDNHITANNIRGNWEPHLARLNNQGRFNAWSTEKADSWIQVDFQRPVVISHVETQGAKQMFFFHYVVNYTISYSIDKKKWIYYKGDSTDFRKTFTGNQDASQVKRNTFFPPLIGRFIRLHPLHFYNSAMVRMEYYGCELDGCSVPLGMENRQIEDYRITASSTASSWLSGPWKASLARLNLRGTVNAWQANNNNLNQWLQVELKQVKKITGIITQGAKALSKEMYVISYRLEYSDDGQHWIKYTDDDNLIFKTFTGNIDNNNHVKNYIHPPIFSRFIRIIPQSWKSSITLRIELLGCDFE
ncbi:hypothetical protein UPYG_G00159150 [Umbra pygmaea]|uniref:ferroxidase n=1 Tax=Umbra pygmaea TaxID=75934 RepID=A0ABD0X3C1_UMBPY